MTLRSRLNRLSTPPVPVTTVDGDEAAYERRDELSVLVEGLRQPRNDLTPDELMEFDALDAKLCSSQDREWCRWMELKRLQEAHESSDGPPLSDAEARELRKLDKRHSTIAADDPLKDALEHWARSVAERKIRR
jgi:hypothetical protein